MTQVLDLLRLYDYRVYYYLYRAGSDSRFFGAYGIVIFFLSFIYLIWRKKIKAFLAILLAMGVASLVDFLVFAFWRRPFPFVSHPEVSPMHLQNFYLDPASFPSSHTYIAFAISISVFLYGHKKLGIVLFLCSFLIAIGNIGTGLHYPTDILGGAILGTLSGVAVYRMVIKWEKRPEARNERPL